MPLGAREAGNRLVKAWRAWQEAPGNREKVLALQEAERIATPYSRLGLLELCARLADDARTGVDIVESVRAILNLPEKSPVSDDTATDGEHPPETVPVPVPSAPDAATDQGQSGISQARQALAAVRGPTRRGRRD
jgi:hypothetical protein